METYAFFAQSEVTIYDIPAESYPPEEGKSARSAIGDQGLYGMPCRVVSRTEDWAEILTHYGYHGFVRPRQLLFVDADAMTAALAKPRLQVTAEWGTVMDAPSVQALPLQEMPRAAVLTAGEREAQNGWANVLLADGRDGWLPEKFLAALRWPETALFRVGKTTDFNAACPDQLAQTLTSLYGNSEEALRAEICRVAQTYLGVQYRWGCKSSRGLDCSGLAGISYMQAGILIYRDAKIMPGWPVREIPRSALRPGDLLFFPGHVAVHLGDGRYIHSTGKAGSNGVVYNSLNPAHGDYRADLDEQMTAAGSIFPQPAAE